ncbi:hypothetical protein [Dactylosporangium matsuzakiense]|uniref:Uncharacterized protein n=1 Tax=Dactylosporangium matsuzakiense TaxID=53360 RepID=A0A9W6NJV4_9ACTN|nr:hypothetical protein GCM10017581_011960 [Dactylosporangium matsuzakiense]
MDVYAECLDGDLPAALNRIALAPGIKQPDLCSFLDGFAVRAIRLVLPGQLELRSRVVA